MPLVDENRILVRHGLEQPASPAAAGHGGLAGRSPNWTRNRDLTSEDLAFTLAPRLNAAGRLGQAQLGVELLITEDADARRRRWPSTSTS